MKPSRLPIGKLKDLLSRCMASLTIFGASAVFLVISACTVVSDVARGVADACSRTSVDVTTTADLRAVCSEDECPLWGAIALANTCNNGMIVELQEDSSYGIDSASATRSSPEDTVFPRITGRLTINGNGAIIHRNRSSVPFERFFLVQTRGDLTLTDLTLERGGDDSRSAIGLSGGTIVNRGTLTLDGVQITGSRTRVTGGAIVNFGRLIVRGGVYSGNVTGGGCEGGGGGFLVNRPEGAASIFGALIEFNRGSCGGGILNEGHIAIVDTTFRGNLAGTGDNNTYAAGGALYNGSEEENEAFAMIVSSTFTENQASQGGALLNARHSRTSMARSTMSGNSTYTPCPACAEFDLPFHRGAAIANFGTLTVDDSTIVNNICDLTERECGGGVHNRTSGALVTAKNTIIAENVGGDCLHDPSESPPARFNATAVNLDSDSTCPSFTIHASPLLGPLQDNGGPTHTHAVRPDTPAHDAGSTCFSADQRHLPRSRSEIDPCDIGAFELQ